MLENDINSGRSASEQSFRMGANRGREKWTLPPGKTERGSVASSATISLRVPYGHAVDGDLLQAPPPPPGPGLDRLRTNKRL